MVVDGSTGKIMLQIANCARDKLHEVRTYSTNCSAKRYKKLPPAPIGHKYYGSYVENFLHAFLGKVFANNGCHSYFGTKKLIRDLKKWQPDIIHLHNLHSFCINIPLLFKYIKKYDIRVVWTLHDCWTFTGHCPYFDMIDCDKWKTGCHHCKAYKEYPKVYWDNTSKIYALKKKCFLGVKDMTLVTPSNWLADLVKQSFLKNYPVEVIHNGIDLNIFKPTESNFRERYNCKNKFIILGVAFGWGKRKGIDVFLELAKRLDERFQIVLVGTDDNVDKQLPSNIISIHRTQNQKELAQIYTEANLFINPTREDNFPTVNIEALACGTPVVTFKTGGSPEILDETCGVTVDKNDIEGIIKAIENMVKDKPLIKEDCLNRAQKFKADEKFLEYIKLYQRNRG